MTNNEEDLKWGKKVTNPMKDRKWFTGPPNTVLLGEAWTFVFDKYSRNMYKIKEMKKL